MKQKIVPPVPERKVDTGKKFTDEQVWKIRDLYNHGISKSEIAEGFEASRPCISDAIHGRGAYRGV